MIDVQQNMVIWVLAGVATYFVYRRFFSSKETSLTDYESEIDEILTSDKYKVKGRFED